MIKKAKVLIIEDTYFFAAGAALLEAGYSYIIHFDMQSALKKLEKDKTLGWVILNVPSTDRQLEELLAITEKRHINLIEVALTAVRPRPTTDRFKYIHMHFFDKELLHLMNAMPPPENERTMSDEELIKVLSDVEAPAYETAHVREKDINTGKGIAPTRSSRDRHSRERRRRYHPHLRLH